MEKDTEVKIEILKTDKDNFRSLVLSALLVLLQASIRRWTSMFDIEEYHRIINEIEEYLKEEKLSEKNINP